MSDHSIQNGNQKENGNSKKDESQKEVQLVLPEKEKAGEDAVNSDEDEFQVTDTAEDVGTMESLEAEFRSIEQSYFEVVKECAKDASLEKFRIEFDKIYNVLHRCHEHELELMTKCRKLQSEMSANGAKLLKHEKLYREDKEQTEKLRKEIEKAWKAVDTVQHREGASTETIHLLKLELQAMTAKMEESYTLHKQKEAIILELEKSKAELLKEKEVSDQKNKIMSEDLIDTMSQLQAYQDKVLEMEANINNTKEELSTLTNEAQRERRRKERIDSELQDRKAQIAQYEKEIAQLQQSCNSYSNSISNLQQSYKDLKSHYELAQKEISLMTSKNMKLETEIQDKSTHNHALHTEIMNKQADLAEKEEEMLSLRRQIGREFRLKETASKKLKAKEDLSKELEKDKETLKHQLKKLESDMDQFRKTMDKQTKLLNSFCHERESLSKSVMKITAQYQKQETLMKIYEQNKRNMTNDMSGLHEKLTKKNALLQSLEFEKDNLLKETRHLEFEMENYQRDIVAKQNEITSLVKALEMKDNMIKKQKSALESVKSDNHLFSKTYLESQDELLDQRRKIKLLSHQIEQLRDEIVARDVTIQHDSQETDKLIKERDNLKLEINKLKVDINNMKVQTDQMERQNMHLRRVIAEATSEHHKQKREIDTVLSERDAIGSQLVRRNDELALVSEKIRLQEIKLERGCNQYKERLNDIQILKNAVKDLCKEKANLKRVVGDSHELKRELLFTQKNLLKEQTRNRALEDELTNPINVHRWRKLQGQDAGNYELVQKLHALQRKVIAKCQEVMKKEELIKEKDALYIELKQLSVKLPGPEIFEKVHSLKSILGAKNKELKALKAEVLMYRNNVEESKLGAEKLQTEIKILKSNYYRMKKKEVDQKKQDSDHKKLNFLTSISSPILSLPPIEK